MIRILHSPFFGGLQASVWLTAEARRARSKGFLIKKYSELCDLCSTILENFRGLRKFSVELKYSNRRIDSRQGAKYAKFGGER
jgi:hypothetical protein